MEKKNLNYIGLSPSGPCMAPPFSMLYPASEEGLVTSQLFWSVFISSCFVMPSTFQNGNVLEIKLLHSRVAP